MNAYPLNARNWDSLKMLFPDRTRYAIIRRACDLKIKHKGSHWTQEELDRLLELKGRRLTYEEMVPHFIDRTAAAIKRKYAREYIKMRLINYDRRCLKCGVGMKRMYLMIKEYKIGSRTKRKTISKKHRPFGYVCVGCGHTVLTDEFKKLQQLYEVM